MTQQSDSDQTLSQSWSEAAALQIQGGLPASSTIPCGCSTQHLLLHPPWTPKSLGLGCFRALCLLSAQGQAGWIVSFPAPSAPQTQPRVCVPVPAPALCPRCGWACSRCWHQLHVPGVQSRSLTLAAQSCLAPRLRERLWKIPVGSCHIQPVAPSDPDKSLSLLGLVCHVQVDFVCLKLGWGRNCSTSCAVCREGVGIHGLCQDPWQCSGAAAAWSSHIHQLPSPTAFPDLRDCFSATRRRKFPAKFSRNSSLISSSHPGKSLLPFHEQQEPGPEHVPRCDTTEPCPEHP